MAKFDASKVVEPLDYDLRPHYDKYGTIAEPRDQQIADYISDVKKLVKNIKEKLPDGMDVAGTADVTELFNAVDDLDPEVVMEFHREMAGVFSALCSGTPSKEDILAIPIRIRVMFYGWIQQEVMSPEAVSGGGTVVTMPRAAAG
jgi:hypothetical protein